MKFDYEDYLSKKEKRKENFSKMMAKVEAEQEEKQKLIADLEKQIKEQDSKINTLNHESETFEPMWLELKKTIDKKIADFLKQKMLLKMEESKKKAEEKAKEEEQLKAQQERRLKVHREKVKKQKQEELRQEEEKRRAEAIKKNGGTLPADYKPLVLNTKEDNDYGDEYKAMLNDRNDKLVKADNYDDFEGGQITTTAANNLETEGKEEGK